MVRRRRIQTPPSYHLLLFLHHLESERKHGTKKARLFHGNISGRRSAFFKRNEGGASRRERLGDGWL